MLVVGSVPSICAMRALLLSLPKKWVASAVFDFLMYFMKAGIATAAKIPMTLTMIIPLAPPKLMSSSMCIVSPLISGFSSCDIFLVE